MSETDPALVEFLVRNAAKRPTAPPAPDQPAVDENTLALLDGGLLDEQERAGLIGALARDAGLRRRAGQALAAMAAGRGRRRAWPIALFVGGPWGGLALAAGLAIVVGLGIYLKVFRGPAVEDYAGSFDAGRLAEADGALDQFGVPLTGKRVRGLPEPLLTDQQYQDGMAKLRPALGRPDPPVGAVTLATRAALAAGKYDEAADFARRWAAAAPAEPAARNALGLAGFQQGQFAGALAQFEQATAMAPREPAFHINAALAADRDNQAAKAAEHLEQFTALAPNHPQIEAVRKWLARLRSE